MTSNKGLGLYTHEESKLNLASSYWEYEFNIKYCLTWLRRYRKSLTTIKNRDDKNREKNI